VKSRHYGLEFPRATEPHVELAIGDHGGLSDQAHVPVAEAVSTDPLVGVGWSIVGHQMLM
jgi:hypothetical protein